MDRLSGTEFSVRGDINMGNGTLFERDEWPLFPASIDLNRCHDGLCVSCATFVAGARHVR